MATCAPTPTRLVRRALLVATLSLLFLGITAEVNDVPSESQCRPYIEKALKDLEAGDAHSGSLETKIESEETSPASDEGDSAEVPPLLVADEPYTDEVVVESDADDESQEEAAEGENASAEEERPEDETIAASAEVEEAGAESDESQENEDAVASDGDGASSDEAASAEQTEDSKEDDSAEGGDSTSAEDDAESQEGENSAEEKEAVEAAEDSGESGESKEDSGEATEEAGDASSSPESAEEDEEAAAAPSTSDSVEEEAGDDSNSEESKEDVEEVEAASSVPESAEEGEAAEDSASAEATEGEVGADDASTESAEEAGVSSESAEETGASSESTEEGAEADEAVSEPEIVKEEAADVASPPSESEEDGDTAEATSAESAEGDADASSSVESAEGQEDADAASTESTEAEAAPSESESVEEQEAGEVSSAPESAEEVASEGEAISQEESTEGATEEMQGDEAASEEGEEAPAAEEVDEMPENDLLLEIDIPENLRSKDHIPQLLRLDEESTEAELLMEKSSDVILRELKRLYDSAIKPLEILYKYRDLSNRHFGDPEIFSKPLVLFMGPWSGGKSSLINYLTNNEFTEWSLRTGAEPSPAYFNILMHGNEPEVLDGTQLAADWTFSGLQKFGQGLEERLRGLKLPNKLLERVNIVEIPGILEVRKQVSRVFPFNDACQWFIDRADVIFLVYDPSKLDVGPETEAILDQLKGRESQTRILLNKADQVKPEELMRVQSALIWNISPLMSSAQPPIMYTTSLWSMPYEPGSPARLLQSQEKSFLKDLRGAIDKRIENKISSARRFAVRVRNHAKMVDCYLTTYYNHKTIFGNKKVVAEAIIEHPQNYHIYEGLSTLTNISRYDLPDPETYRDFFRLNPLYEFQQLSATCTYFRGCPINRLDVAIAYDLPELVGKYKKMVETATPQGMPKS